MAERFGRLDGQESTVLSVRLTLQQLERLDRYLDLAETLTGLKGNRNLVLRRALDEWLDRHEEALNIPPPESESAAPKLPSARKKRTTGKKSTSSKRRRNDAQTSDPDDAC